MAGPPTPNSYRIYGVCCRYHILDTSQSISAAHGFKATLLSSYTTQNLDEHEHQQFVPHPDYLHTSPAHNFDYKLKMPLAMEYGVA